MIAKTLRYFFLFRPFWVWVLLLPVAVQAQFGELLYRPAGLKYKVLKTDHFDLIHYEGQEETARQAATILENNLSETQKLIGNHEPFRLSVVLNGYNDASNGFVTVFPFRSEIEVPAIRGKYLHPGAENWLEAVLPHELVHAVEIDHYKRNTLTRLFPEWARFTNAFRPSGFLEGVAVYQESKLHDGEVGRLNHPFFTMQYRASMGSPFGWTLSQAITPNYYGMPSGRHYLGGSYLVQFLADEFGDGTYQRYSKAFAKRPYLGTAFALYKATGKWPYELNKLFREQEIQAERRRVGKLGAITKPQLLGNRIGAFHNNPIWTDDKTVLTYGTGYHDRPGFYLTDVESGTTRVLAHEQINEDHAFSFDPNNGEVLWGDYNDVLNTPTQFISDINKLALDTGKKEELTNGKRVFTPIRNENGTLWATQNRGESSDWVEILPNGETKTVCASGYGRLLEIAPRPGTEEVYVLLNVRGEQGIFKAKIADTCTFEPVALTGKGSVFDPSWSRDGRWMLFTADSTGVPNVYAWDTKTNQHFRLTNAPYGAYEAAFSPDGSQVAVVWYGREQESIGILPFIPEKLKKVPGFAQSGKDKNWAEMLTQVPIAPYEGGLLAPYKPLDHLKNWVVPVSARLVDEEKSGLGLQIIMIDVLRRFKTTASAFWLGKRPWGEVSVGTAQLPLRPTFSVFNRPTYRLGDMEELGMGLALTKPLIRQSGVFPIQADISLAGFQRWIRPYDLGGGFTANTGVSGGFLLYHKAQANVRDLRPNTGTILSANGSWDKSKGEEKGLLSFDVAADRYIGYGKARNRSGKVSVAYATFNEADEHFLSSLRIPGYPTTPPGRHFLRIGADYLTPVWYIDRGIMTLPVHADVLYATVFGNSVINTTQIESRHTAFGLGLGLRFRVFRNIALDVQYNLAYKVQDQNFMSEFYSN